MMENNRIEVLDVEDDITTVVDSNIEETKKEEIGKEVDSNMVIKNTKKRRLKKGVFQTIFCIISLLFIIGCCIFYGNRLIKYYKIYNPKSESGEAIQLISNALIQGTPIVFEGSGIYRESGVYAYKGVDSNNYIKYSNLIWRIVRTNVDGSLEIILDDYINVLAWDFDGNNYADSDINKYLNEVFIKNLDTRYLVKTTICNDEMESIDKYSCNDKNNNYYVKLLPANDFLNTVADGATYVAGVDELIWLGTAALEDNVWHTNGSNLSSSVQNSAYLVKPVVTIKNSTALLGGKGTKEEPFIIEKENNSIKIGSYVEIDEDTWVVYEKDNNNIKLVYSDLYNNGLSTYRFDVDKIDFNPENDNSLAKLLNTTFYESLSYKDLLLDFDVYTGLYDMSYEDIYDSKVTVKVGIQSVVDLKFNNDANGYYLSTKASSDKVFYYKDGIFTSKPGMSRVYRPTISIKIPDDYEGNGTNESPFVIEVEHE